MFYPIKHKQRFKRSVLLKNILIQTIKFISLEMMHLINDFQQSDISFLHAYVKCLRSIISIIVNRFTILRL